MAPGQPGDARPGNRNTDVMPTQTKVAIRDPRPASDRYGSVELAIAIYRTLRRSARTLDELAQIHKVTPLTVRRLIDALRRSGVSIATARRGPGNAPIEYRADGI